MKAKLILILCTLVCISFSNAQENNPPKLREFYISFANFSPLNISLSYKHEIGNNLLFKIGAIGLSMSLADSKSSISTTYPSKTSMYSAGLLFGLEFRSNLSDKFALFHGPNVSYTYFYQETETNNPSLSPEQQKSSVDRNRYSIPYTFGILFNLSSSIFFSAEINPNLYYSVNKNTSNGNGQSVTITENLGGVSISNSGMISIVYRF